MSSKIAPGPSFFKLLSQVSAIQKNLVSVFHGFFEQYGNTFQVPLGIHSLYLFRTPEAAKEVLQEKSKSFKRSYEVLKPLVGEGLLTSEGDKWKRQRKMMAPLFHQKSIDHFYAVVVDEVRLLSRQWSAIPDGEILVDPWMMKTTLNIIGKTMLSTDISAHSDQIGQCVTQVMDIIARQTKAVFPVPSFLPTPEKLKLRREIRNIDRIFNETIRKRKEKAIEEKDMLDLLLGMEEEQTGKGLSSSEIRDHLSTMILAGHESTATAMSWALYLLAKHPDIQERLHQEIIHAVKPDQAPSMDDLYEMKLLNQVFKEVLRLYPPFWYLERRTVEEVEIDGFKVPNNQRVVISPYFVHRNPEVWENPDEFKPERFEDEVSENRHKMAWIPFGGGPRYCIGQPLATLEILALIFELVRKFRFELVHEHSVEFNPTISLRAKNGILVKKFLRSSPTN